MEAWHREIVELHEFFVAYFRGALEPGELDRLEAALAPAFTIVAPSGRESTRAATIEAIRAGHAQAPQMVIEIRSARLLVDRPDVVVARYVEHHESADENTDAVSDRLSTVVFERAPGSPNGFRWRTVHETWLPAEPARPAG